MNQQNAESKLEQAAGLHADNVSFRVPFDGTNEFYDLKHHEWAKESFISGAKSEAAKEYWQSLTTPAGNEVEEILKKYKTFVSNIEWHIKTNEPKGDDLKQCELRLDCYNEIVTDLERIPSKPHQEQAADKCRCSDDIKTGQTSVMCCNVCGRPDEGFWITGQTQEPVKCNGNCGMNYCDEYGCIENKPEGDVSHLLTPPPSPVGIEVDHEAEKEVMMQAFDKVYKMFQSRSWIMDGRGSYPYNDDRYKEEVRYLYDEFESLHKDTWANIKSKSVDFRKKVIEQYKKDLENPYFRLSEAASLPQSSTEEEKGERMFTLKEMVDCWHSAHNRADQNWEFNGDSVVPNKQQYFKQKFNIEI